MVDELHTLLKYIVMSSMKRKLILGSLTNRMTTIPIDNFPVCNISDASTYGVYVSLLIHYPKAFSKFHDFLSNEDNCLLFHSWLMVIKKSKQNKKQITMWETSKRCCYTTVLSATTKWPYPALSLTGLATAKPSKIFFNSLGNLFPDISYTHSLFRLIAMVGAACLPAND